MFFFSGTPSRIIITFHLNSLQNGAHVVVQGAFLNFLYIPPFAGPSVCLPIYSVHTLRHTLTRAVHLIRV